jgi:hypothetical protein
MDDFSIPGASNAFGLAPFTTNYVEVRLAAINTYQYNRNWTAGNDVDDVCY